MVIRDAASRYFAEKGITWHQHANHALSSQVSCLNFLMPPAERPDILARLVREALGGDLPIMLPVETGPDGRDWFVGFEWIGAKDYLNEANQAGTRTRGANATSADAVLRFERDNRIETLLIEWKYTESYGAPIPPAGNPTRRKRYADLAFAPVGPIRSDVGLELTDFFFEPFYQFLRQQMLAKRMEQAGEAGAEYVRVLHIAPRANIALQRITSPALRDKANGEANAFKLFRSLLAEPDRFVSRATEDLFKPLLLEPNDAAGWAAYLKERYAFLSRAHDD